MHDYMFMQGVYLGGLAVWDDATLLWTSPPLAGPAPGPRAHPGLAAGPGGRACFKLRIHRDRYSRAESSAGPGTVAELQVQVGSPKAPCHED